VLGVVSFHPSEAENKLLFHSLVVALRVCEVRKVDAKLLVQVVLSRFDLVCMHVSDATHEDDIAVRGELGLYPLLLVGYNEFIEVTLSV